MSGRKRHHTDCHISADLHIKPKLLKHKMINYLKLKALNRSVWLISNFDDQSLSEDLKTLTRIKPYLIQGHPSTMYALAKYVEKNGKTPVKVSEVFEPSGEMLTESMVEKIEKFLTCKVVNRYGNVEFGVIAHSYLSDKFNRLRVFDNCFYLEQCEKSKIIVTGLTNLGMPLLRYDTGDIGTVTFEKEGSFL